MMQSELRQNIIVHAVIWQRDMFSHAIDHRGRGPHIIRSKLIRGRLTTD